MESNKIKMNQVESNPIRIQFESNTNSIRIQFKSNLNPIQIQFELKYKWNAIQIQFKSSRIQYPIRIKSIQYDINFTNNIHSIITALYYTMLILKQSFPNWGKVDIVSRFSTASIILAQKVFSVFA